MSLLRRRAMLSVIEGGFIPEFQVVYDSWVIKPDQADALLWNTMVEALVAAGVWGTKLDVFYFFSVHTNANGEALTNWINPGTFDATLVNAPTFTAFEGFQGDGVTQYIDHNWNPSVNGINYTLNAAGAGIYSRTDINEASIDTGVIAGGQSLMALKFGGFYNARLNSAGIDRISITDTLGQFACSRYDSANLKAWQNKIVRFDLPENTTSVPNGNVFSLAFSNSGSPASFTTRQISNLFYGGLFIQQNTDDLTDAVEVVMDAKGKGVIP